MCACFPGCFVSGLYLEGADWDMEEGCLVRSKAKVLVVQLPILKVIPIEAHRLSLRVRTTPPTQLSYLSKCNSAGQGSPHKATSNPCVTDSGQACPIVG